MKKREAINVLMDAACRLLSRPGLTPEYRECIKEAVRVWWKEYTGLEMCQEDMEAVGLIKKGKKAMIEPSIGRAVWFYPKGHKKGDQPLSATVAYVHGSRCINIGALAPNGCPVAYPPTSVTLVQPEDEIPADGPYCTWMPFQVGQSEKVKAAQAEVK